MKAPATGRGRSRRAATRALARVGGYVEHPETTAGALDANGNSEDEPRLHAPGASSASTYDGVSARRVRGRGRLVRRMLMLADVTGLIVAFALALVLFRSRVGPEDPVEAHREILLFVATLPLWVILARLHGLYDRDEERASHSTRDDLVGVFHLVTVGTFLFFAGAWLTGLAKPYPPKLLTFWVLAIASIALARVFARAFARTRQAYIQNAVIVGADRVGTMVARKILDHPEYGVNIVGLVDPQAERGTTVAGGVPVLGPPEELPEIVRSLEIERVIVAFFDRPVDEAIALVRWVKDFNVQIDVVPRLFAAVDPRAQIHTLEGFPLIGLPPARLWRTSLLVKRGLDIAVAALGLVLLSPVFAWIALRLRLDSEGPVLYRHERVGLYGRPFRLIKFRTMHIEHCLGSGYGGDAANDALNRVLQDPDAREEFERTHKLADDPRVTRYGRFLRRSSLDELPQLLNVLRGDISLVGPRPVTAEELTRYGDEVDALLSFHPGVTGYWQVNGRSRTDYEERVRLDIAYVRGWSLKLDLAILGKTAWTLVKGRDAY